MRVDGKPDAEIGVGIGIVGGGHGQGHDGVEIAALDGPAGADLVEEGLDVAAVFGQAVQRAGHVGHVNKVEGHVSRVAGDGVPVVGITQTMGDCTVAAT